MWSRPIRQSGTLHRLGVVIVGRDDASTVGAVVALAGADVTRSSLLRNVVIHFFRISKTRAVTLSAKACLQLLEVRFERVAAVAKADHSRVSSAMMNTSARMPIMTMSDPRLMSCDVIGQPRPGSGARW